MPEPNKRRVWVSQGEDRALRHLANKGHEVLERNYRTRHGEINLTVHDDKDLSSSRSSCDGGLEFGDPLKAVTSREQVKIRLMAGRYPAKKGENVATGFDEVRFDVVGILLGTGTPRSNTSRTLSEFSKSYEKAYWTCRSTVDTFPSHSGLCQFNLLKLRRA